MIPKAEGALGGEEIRAARKRGSLTILSREPDAASESGVGATGEHEPSGCEYRERNMSDGCTRVWLTANRTA